MRRSIKIAVLLFALAGVVCGYADFLESRSDCWNYGDGA